MSEEQQYDVDFGHAVYTEDGRKLGTVRGSDGNGIYVALTGDVSAPMPHRTSGATGAGEADLVWRCRQCGEVGEIEDMPDECPSCGAGAEELYYWTED